MKNQLSPKEALEILQKRGLKLSFISRFLGKPSNYATRIQSGQIMEPSYIIVDKLRELAAQLDDRGQKARRNE